MITQLIAGALFLTQSPASVRVVNAIVDTEWVSLTVSGATWSGVPYGQRTSYASVPGGQGSASVIGRRGERIANEVSIKHQAGYPHTIIFTGFPSQKGSFNPIVLRDSTAGKPANSNVQFQFVNALSDGQSVSILLNGKKIRQSPILKNGESSALIGYDPREYSVELQSANGESWWKTSIKAVGGMRYTAIVMGASGQSGNRAPRIFFYAF